jgi:hypothetical protein
MAYRHVRLHHWRHRCSRDRFGLTAQLIEPLMPRSESIHPAYHELRMKQDAAFFEGKSPVLIYIAKKLKEALRLEDALAEAGIDYGVEADEYRGGVVFRSARVGAFFYVLPEAVQSAYGAMVRNRFTPHVE